MAATIGTRLYTLLNGRRVGIDAFGNRYYESRRARNGEKHPRRWVMYNGKVEASKVPAEWHGWLHYTLDAPVEAAPRQWQKPHLPNLTGTQGRYLPPGHISSGAPRAAASADYQPWTPE